LDWSEWTELEWDGMGWDGMEWTGREPMTEDKKAKWTEGEERKVRQNQADEHTAEWFPTQLNEVEGTLLHLRSTVPTQIPFDSRAFN
jgi:hypothetical protein